LGTVFSDPNQFYRNHHFRSVNKIFDEPLAVDMFLDVMIERGIHNDIGHSKGGYPCKGEPRNIRNLHKNKKDFPFSHQISNSKNL
jgi:hypothetical protein